MFLRQPTRHDSHFANPVDYRLLYPERTHRHRTVQEYTSAETRAMLWAENGLPSRSAQGCQRRDPTDHPHRLSASAVKHGGCGRTCTSRRTPGRRGHVDRWQLPVPRTGCPSQAGGLDLSGGGFPVPIVHPCSLPGSRRCRGRQTCRLDAGTRYAHPLLVIRTLNADLPAPYPGSRSLPVHKSLGRRTDPSQRPFCHLPSCPRAGLKRQSPTGQEELPSANLVSQHGV